MLRRISILALSTPLLWTAAATALPAPAEALTFAPCAGIQEFSCATLNVPLERSGTVSSTIALGVERLQTGSAPASSAVLTLAGGPGQAALPLAQSSAKLIAPALAGRDMLVFDQRGTGTSGPLACAALEGEEILGSIGQAFERCAQQIGTGRSAYTTQESVADIEALRQA